MRWEQSEECDGASPPPPPFPQPVVKFLHVVQVLLGLTLIIIHVRIIKKIKLKYFKLRS